MPVRWERLQQPSGLELRQRSWLAVGVGVVLIVGCGGSDTPNIDASTPESLAESLGCGDVSELDPMLAPIRGRGATRGISCEIDGETIHVFARAPIGDPNAVGWGQGGTDENIRRLLGADAVDPSCKLAVLISDDVSSSGRPLTGSPTSVCRARNRFRCRPRSVTSTAAPSGDAGLGVRVQPGSVATTGRL